MKSLKFIVPLAVFVVLAIFLGRGLNLNPREVPSPLIGKPAPAFALPLLPAAAAQPAPAGQPAQLSRDDMAGKVWVLNVWASWCVPCRAEHPLLVELGRRRLAPIVGLNYKDKTADAQTFLARLGNPYAATVVDADGRVAIDWGVYGVPETFVVDKQGTIRFKHIGPLTPEVVKDKLEPLLRQLNG